MSIVDDTLLSPLRHGRMASSSTPPSCSSRTSSSSPLRSSRNPCRRSQSSSVQLRREALGRGIKDAPNSHCLGRIQAAAGRLPFYLAVLLVICSCLTVSNAHLQDESELFKSTLDRLERRRAIYPDQAVPPIPGRLIARQVFSDASPTRPAPKSSKTTSTSTSTKASRAPTRSPSTSPKPTSSSDALAGLEPITAPPSDTPNKTASDSSRSKSSSTSTYTTLVMAPTNSPLPRVFDTSLGTNFTSTDCPNFIQSFLSDTSFESCVPFSLLLQNSNSFFQAEKSIVRITQTLDASCSVDYAMCSAKMAKLAQDLMMDQHCRADYINQNPIVVQAYEGLVAYKPMYQAGCLKARSGSYCFADAVTNVTSPTDSYIYYLPLGVSLPGGSSPTCNNCLQQTLGIFAAAASNKSQPINQNYVETAQLINLNCGPGFVNQTIPPAKTSAASALVGSWGTVPLTVISTMAVLLGTWLL